MAPKRQRSVDSGSSALPSLGEGPNSQSDGAVQGQTIHTLIASSNDPGSSFRGVDSQVSQLSEVSLAEADEPITKAEQNAARVFDVRLRLMSDASEAQKQIDALDTVEDGFCRLVKLKPSKENGYIQLSWQGANKYAVLQEVLIWAKGLQAQHGQHISHLCDKPRCAIKEHVVVESPAENNSRKNCGMVIDCAHCPKKYHACRHQPPCITFVEGFSSWPDFLANGRH